MCLGFLLTLCELDVMVVLGLLSHTLWNILEAGVAVLELLRATLWDYLSLWWLCLIYLPTLFTSACQL